MNTPAPDTLILTLTQLDGETVISKLHLEYPGLSNEMANLMSLRLVDAIKNEVAQWATMKAESGQKTGDMSGAADLLRQLNS